MVHSMYCGWKMDHNLQLLKLFISNVTHLAGLFIISIQLITLVYAFINFYLSFLSSLLPKTYALDYPIWHTVM